jgi:two-component system, cell cycle sensor histidine kinase and response regulator CckA
MLTRLGFDVVLAEHGAEAVEIVSSRGDEFRLVLMDLTMPHMDGEQAFREIRRVLPGLPVLLSSGYNEQDAISRFVGKGLAGFLQKPYTMQALTMALRELLQD